MAVDRTTGGSACFGTMAHFAAPAFFHSLIEVRPVVLGLALILDWLVGEMPILFARVPHPVVLAGRAIALFDRKLNREHRSETVRRARGIATLAVLLPAAWGVGEAIHRIAALAPSGWLIELGLVTILLAQRSLYDHVRAVAVALDRQGLEAGRRTVGAIVGRNTAVLDEPGVARAAIESLAENFSDGVVAPVCAYLVGGLPALCLYKMANTLDSMIGHRNARYRAFGWASARFDDLLNLIPARLAGLLIALAALFVAKGRAWQAIATMARDAGKHRSLNAGWPEAAMAGALDLALAGPRQYGAAIAADPWLGTGRPQATSLDIHRALGVYRLACSIEFALVLLLVSIETA